MLKLSPKEVREAIEAAVAKKYNRAIVRGTGVLDLTDGSAGATPQCRNKEGPDYGYEAPMFGSCELPEGHAGDHEERLLTGVSLTWPNND